MYCTEAEFRARFGEQELEKLLDTDTGQLYEAAANDADAIVHAYIGGRYATPMASAPALIIGIAADLTRYELYDEAPPKEVAERRKHAIALLEQIRDGQLHLTGAAANLDSPTVAVSAAPQVFTEATMAGYMGIL